jgi:hypothetical protein
MMEFVPLRSLQRGLPEVWQTLRQEAGRVVLTNKGQPAYLLVDLEGLNVISLINLLDDYRRSSKELADVPAEDLNTTPREQRLAAIKAILTDVALPDEGNIMTDADWAEMENLRARTNLIRTVDL